VAFYYLKKLEEESLITRNICKNKIYIQKISWIPTDDHYFPDALSRCFNAVEWEVSKELFEMINISFGHRQIRFRQEQKAPQIQFPKQSPWKGDRKYRCPLSNLERFLNYECPPLNLISRILELITN
jgi:hypothetical protein